MIRAATHDDLPALVALGAFLHDESPRYRVRSFDPVRCSEHLRSLIDGAGVVFVTLLPTLMVAVTSFPRLWTSSQVPMRYLMIRARP